jgi:hypothetical protein
MVLTLLAVTGMTTASLELQMAGNGQYRERAFQAAEAGLERAIQAGVYDTESTIGTYVPSADPAVPPTPQRGTGIRGCLQGVDADGVAAATGDCYEYFMRFDDQSGPTPVPGGGPELAGFRALHFVVDAFGSSGRHAESHHAQGFYVVVPDPAAPLPACPPEAADCTPAPAGTVVRTYWRKGGS